MTVEVLNVAKGWTIKDKPKDIIGTGAVVLSDWISIWNQPIVDNCINLISPKTSKQQGRVFLTVELVGNAPTSVSDIQETFDRCPDDNSINLRPGDLNLVSCIYVTFSYSRIMLIIFYFNTMLSSTIMHNLYPIKTYRGLNNARRLSELNGHRGQG